MRWNVTGWLGLALGTTGVALALAQAPTGGPTAQEALDQLTTVVHDQYDRALREKILAPSQPPTTDAGAQVFLLSEQLRITTQQCTNRDNDAYQLIRFKDGELAKYQLMQAEQGTLIRALRAENESLKNAAGKKPETSSAAPPTAITPPAAEGKTP